MPHLQFETRATVACSDGPCGVLSRVVIDPVEGAVTDLEAEPRQEHSLARLVPVEMAEVEDEEIRLDSCRRDTCGAPAIDVEYPEP